MLLTAYYIAIEKTCAWSLSWLEEKYASINTTHVVACGTRDTWLPEFYAQGFSCYSMPGRNKAIPTLFA